MAGLWWRRSDYGTELVRPVMKRHVARHYRQVIKALESECIRAIAVTGMMHYRSLPYAYGCGWLLFTRS
jgi:hypothetical protein